MRGKPILSSLVNQCFEVVDDYEGKVLTGPEAVTLVADELLQQEFGHQPKDFQELHKLIASRVQLRT